MICDMTRELFSASFSLFYFYNSIRHLGWFLNRVSFDFEWILCVGIFTFAHTNFCHSNATKNKNKISPIWFVERLRFYEASTNWLTVIKIYIHRACEMFRVKRYKNKVDFASNSFHLVHIWIFTLTRYKQKDKRISIMFEFLKSIRREKHLNTLFDNFISFFVRYFFCHL